MTKEVLSQYSDLQEEIKEVRKKIAKLQDDLEKIESGESVIDKVPIWEKVTLTIDEAAEYSNIGINRINDMLNNPSCPFVLFVGRGKRLVKRKEFEKYLEKTDSI